MSKEQTLTAEEVLLHESYKVIAKIMEQYAQAKVLEALEREVPKAFYKGFTVNQWWAGRHINSIPIYDTIEEEIERLDQTTSYYETEVKPKYE